jgi:hypothetical protein
MNDRELLGNAVIAGGLDLHRIIEEDVENDSPIQILVRDSLGELYTWRPLDDLGQAADLALHMHMTLSSDRDIVVACVSKYRIICCEPVSVGYSRNKLMCRAIVRAAAASYLVTNNVNITN